MADERKNQRIEDEALEDILRTYATTPEPDAVFMARLERKLLAARSERFRTLEADAPGQTRGPLAVVRAWWRRGQRVMSAVGTAAALVLIIAAVGLFGSWVATMHPSTNGAAPVAANATSAATVEVASTNAPESVPSTTSSPAESVVTIPEPADVGLGRIAYVQAGDIWVKAIPGGEPQQLTTTGNAQAPRWSQSGRWLAFREGDVLRVVDSELPEAAFTLQTTEADGFAWSPVADQLAFTAGNKLQLLDVVSGLTTDLVARSAAGTVSGEGDSVYRVSNPHWRPDGTAIAYEQSKMPSGASDTVQGSHSIWLAALDGSAPRQLYDSGIPEKGEAILAGWTSDGQHLLFWQGPMLSASLMMDGVPLYVLSLSGDGQQPVAVTVEGATEAPSVLVRPEFIAPAPASREVAVTMGAGRDTWSNKKVGAMDPATGLWQAKTPEDAVTIAPAWSPDGQQLAYVTIALNAGEAEAALRARRIEIVAGSERRQLTDDAAYRDEHPQWSADGSHILFARVNEQEQASLWLVPANGGEPELVVEVLSPAPEDTGWVGAFGYVNWGQYYDWWQAPNALP